MIDSAGVADAIGLLETDGAWHHLALVYDGALAPDDRVKLFADGVRLNAPITGVIPPALPNYSNGTINVGPAEGIDEFLVFDRPLNAAEVLQLVNARP